MSAGELLGQAPKLSRKLNTLFLGDVDMAVAILTCRERLGTSRTCPLTASQPGHILIVPAERTL